MIITGNCLDVLPTLPEKSVQCCVTSPPYWGLRDYGVAGQLGLEKTPEEYVAKMVEVFREVKWALRDDGTLWLNLGDSYASGGRGGCWIGDENQQKIRGWKSAPAGLKNKDLVGIPWRVAFALQSDGWYLRQDIIWHKPNPMPESVTDRCTKAHEYIFLLTKSARYFYDQDAIKEPAAFREDARPFGTCDSGEHGQSGRVYDSWKGSRFEDEKNLINHPNVGKVRPSAPKGSFNGKTEAMADTGQNAFRAVTMTRNRRSVWTISTKPFREAHFATFPPEIPMICIRAGSKPGDTILDPFAGAGTVGYVCEKLDRKFIGIELNPSYVDMAKRRIASVAPLFSEESPW